MFEVGVLHQRDKKLLEIQPKGCPSITHVKLLFTTCSWVRPWHLMFCVPMCTEEADLTNLWRFTPQVTKVGGCCRSWFPRFFFPLRFLHSSFLIWTSKFCFYASRPNGMIWCLFFPSGVRECWNSLGIFWESPWNSFSVHHEIVCY